VTEIKMYSRDELEDGQYIQFVGVHILAWKRLQREYGIPDWKYAFVIDKQEADNDDN